MTDDMKKYWDQRRRSAEQAPHFKPAHETQGKSISMPNFGQPPNGPAPMDRDVTSMLQNRLQQQMMQSQMGPTQAQVVDLQEGLPYYISVENSFGGTTPLIRSAGIINGRTSKNVQIRKEVKGYLIDNLPSVDMSKMTENPGRMINLVEISVPFLGNFLVPKEAIIRKESSPFGDGRSILKG